MTDQLTTFANCKASQLNSVLQPFIDCLNTDQIMQVIAMFKTNKRVQDELYQSRPKQHALALLLSFGKRLTIEAHKNTLKEVCKYVGNL